MWFVMVERDGGVMVESDAGSDGGLAVPMPVG